MVGIESFADIIKVVTSPFGLAALSFLILGSVALAFFRRDKDPRIRLGAFSLLGLALISTVLAAVFAKRNPAPKLEPIIRHLFIVYAVEIIVAFLREVGD